MRLVATAQARLSHASSADRAAAILFLRAVMSGGDYVFTYCVFSGDKEHALIRTATVLIIACPHALGLAIRLVSQISTHWGLKTVSSLRTDSHSNVPANWTLVIFDKTGL